MAEVFVEGESAIAAAERLARSKARAIEPADGAVVAADTIVVRDGALLGKPEDTDAARAMIRSLAGRSHEVITGVCVRTAHEEHAIAVSTEVVFRALTDDEIAAYVSTGEPFDKAGGYGIQGEGGALVDTVRGSYTNVVGLPLKETLALLARVGALPRG